MNLQEVCRTCLCSGRTMSSLFNSTVTIVDLEPIVVSELFKVFTEIQISHEDGFPNQICTDCLDEIKRSYCFTLKCQRSEAILHQLKKVKIKLKKLINFPSDNDKTCTPYKELNLNISQIKNENIECVEITNEDEKGSTACEKSVRRVDNRLDNDSELRDTLTVKKEEILEDGELEQDNLLTGLLDPMSCTYSVTLQLDSVIQDIKQEPELHIVMDEDDFHEIHTETNESKDQSITDIFRCPGCPYNSLNIEILNNHIIDNHMEQKFCKICNEGFECSAIQHCSKHISINLDSMHASTSSTNINDENFQIYKSLSNTNFPSDTTINPFKCEICYSAFKTELGKQYHTMMNHEIQCPICWKSFKYKANLEAHISLHFSDQFKCIICSELFQNETDLKNHEAGFHAISESKYGNFNCLKCSKSFEQKNKLIKHIKRDTCLKPFKCKFCFISFQYEDTLKSHVPKNGMKCEICENIFVCKSHLTTHLRSHTNEEKFKCGICLENFRLKEDLRSHWQTVHSIFVPTDNNQSFEECKICLKTFRHKTSLKNHIRDAHQIDARKEKSSLQCSLCPQMCKNENSLAIHMRVHTGGVKQFECKICSETFRVKCSLKNHLRWAHGIFERREKKDSQCSVCSKFCGNKYQLTVHKRVHTGEKPFECEVCLKTFGYKQSLKNHLRAVHRISKRTEKKGLQCSMCSRICINKYTLAIHKRVHIGIDEDKPRNIVENVLRCDACSEIFTCESNLILHLRSHLREKQFKCEICSETFRYKLTFENHMRTKHAHFQ